MLIDAGPLALMSRIGDRRVDETSGVSRESSTLLVLFGGTLSLGLSSSCICTRTQNHAFSPFSPAMTLNSGPKVTNRGSDTTTPVRPTTPDKSPGGQRMGAPRERAPHGLSSKEAKNGSGAAKKAPDRITQKVEVEEHLLSWSPFFRKRLRQPEVERWCVSAG